MKDEGTEADEIETKFPRTCASPPKDRLALAQICKVFVELGQSTTHVEQAFYVDRSRRFGGSDLQIRHRSVGVV
jgi:hypothetical protein